MPAPPPDVTRYLWGPPPVENWTRHFRVGMLVGLNIKADFSLNGRFGISGAQRRPPGVYDDGYVREDQTGNAQGYTGYWGYDNAAQYDPAARTLQMHGANSFDTTGSARRSDAPFLGFDMAYGDSYWRWKRVRIGWELGFGLLPVNITDDRSLPAQINRTVYSFNVPDGVVAPTIRTMGDRAEWGSQPSRPIRRRSPLKPCREC